MSCVTCAVKGAEGSAAQSRAAAEGEHGEVEEECLGSKDEAAAAQIQSRHGRNQLNNM